MADLDIINAAADAEARETVVALSVEPAHFDSVWACVEHDIAQALLAYLPGACSIADCRQLCMSGHTLLWIAVQHGKVVGAAISEEVTQPQGRAVRLFLTDYGAEWSPYLTSAIEEWAADSGIATILTVAPPGLGHILGRPITTYWRMLDGGPLRDVPQTAIPTPSARVH